jgi:hypothetical protein
MANGGSIIVILLVEAGAVWVRTGWHTCSTKAVGIVLPTKANRSRGRGAKPQIRNMRHPDRWAAEDRAGLAPGEQARRTGGGHVNVDIAD